MSKRTNYISITLRTIIFIFIPTMIVVAVLYQSFFNSGIRTHGFTTLMYLVFLVQWMIDRYKNESRFVYVKHKEVDHALLTNEWEIIDRRRDGLSVRPSFDRPFNYIINDKMSIQYKDHNIKIEGPAHYVSRLSEELNTDAAENPKKHKANLRYLFAALAVMIPMLLESGLFWEAKVLYHNVQANSADSVSTTLSSERGNSAENSNSGGYGVTDDEYLYLIEYQDSLTKINTLTEEKEVIIQYESESWIDELNLVNDWLYYTGYESLNRVKTDGTSSETIYDLGHLFDVHIVNDWIYFINAEDSLNPYRMNLDGGEVERLMDVSASDIVVYEEYLLVSYYDEHETRLERVDLDGSNREIILEDTASQVLRHDGFYYYLGEDFSLYKLQTDGKSEPEQLINQQIRLFTLTDQGIVFVLAHFGDYYESDGIYQSALDGTDRHLVDQTKYANRLIKVGDDVLYNTMQGSNYESLEKVELPLH